MKELVTIGITCFNAESTIERAIHSAFSQDWPDFEVLIVDDKSTDSSIKAIEQAIINKPNAKLLKHQDNTGPAGARNTIIKNAKGIFIAFFDDDDEALPHRIRTQAESLKQYEKRSGAELVCCYASGERRYANGYTLELNAIGSKGTEVPSGPEVADYLLLYEKKSNWFYGNGTPSCSLMLRKSTIKAVDGFDENLRRVEDVDLAIRLALKGCHFIGTKENLFIQYSTNAMDKSPEKNLNAEQAIVKKHKNYLQKKQSFYYALYWPRLRYYHFRKRYFLFLLQLFGLFCVKPIKLCRHLLSTGPRRLQHEKRMRKAQT